MANKIVVLGAGYGGLKATQKLSDYLGDSSEHSIILVNKHNFHMLMTLLHESATGTSDFDDVSIPIDKVLEGKHVQFIKGTVEQIDITNRTIKTNQGELSYNYLLIALGSEPEYYDIPGLRENSLSLRSLYSSIEIRRRINDILAKHQQPLTFVVGGGGLTGVEFAGELAHQLQRISGKYQIAPEECKIIVVEGAKELLPGLSTEMGRYSRETLEQMGVEVITEDFISQVTPDTVYLASGQQIRYSLLIWAGGIKGNRILEQSGFKTANRGRVPVNQYLQYVDNPNVYLVGDNALAIDPRNNKPVAATAQSALQQAEIAAYNIYADIMGLEKKIYRPNNIGTVISIGRSKAFGEVKSFKFKGPAASWLKELIPVKYRYSLGGLKFLS